MKEILLNYFQNSFLNERSLDVFRNESFVMEDNLVEDVSRGASLVVEGMQRNRGETTSVEDPRQLQQQTPFRQNFLGTPPPGGNQKRGRRKIRSFKITN